MMNKDSSILATNFLPDIFNISLFRYTENESEVILPHTNKVFKTLFVIKLSIQADLNSSAYFSVQRCLSKSFDGR